MADTMRRQHKHKLSTSFHLKMPQSLPQSYTDMVRTASDQSEAASIISTSIATDSCFYSTTAQNTEYTENSDSDSSNSSNWDSHSIISTVSTVLPPRVKHQNIDIKQYHSEQYLIEFKEDRMDIAYHLYSLFYPFTNLQSLIFSHLQPYIETDYKKNKAFGNNNDDDEVNISYDDGQSDIQMDWKDLSSVNRIKDLITKLLSTSSSNKGIKEEDIYLMFSSPSPLEIIEQLRFGKLSSLCDVHMDRFGRRTFHYRKHHRKHNHHHHGLRSQQLYFFDHSSVPSTLFADNDIVGLSDFGRRCQCLY